MKRFIFILLLLTQVWALSLSKTVSGPELIDINENIDVSLIISSDEAVYLEKLEDVIPTHFIAENYPSSCQQTEDTLVCIFGQEMQGQIVIDYSLLALGNGYGMMGSPKLFYEGGMKTIDFFRQYFIGKPRIEMSLDGDLTLLPGENISVLVSLRNPGTKSIDEASLVLNFDDQIISHLVSLSPGEIIEELFILGEAESKGYLKILAEISWGNESRTNEMTVVFISPSLSISRDVKVKWNLDENKELQKYVEVSYKLYNNGTALGNISMLSGESFSVSPGELKTITKTYSETAPVEKISVKDSRGVLYGVHPFEEMTPEIKKGFFVLIYEYVASEISPWILFGIFIGALYFSKKFKGSNLKAGFLLLALISLLLLYSYYSVGAISMPGFGPKDVSNSISLQFPKNLSGDLFS